jgi:hypothetical protein
MAEEPTMTGASTTTDASTTRGGSTVAEGDDEQGPGRDEGAEPPGRLARIRTTLTEADGVVADAVLDAI